MPEDLRRTLISAWKIAKDLFEQNGGGFIDLLQNLYIEALDQFGMVSEVDIQEIVDLLTEASTPSNIDDGLNSNVLDDNDFKDTPC